jgi:hypothetical protein
MAVATVHADSFREWNIYDEEDQVAGLIRPVWDIGDRQFSEWQFDFGSYSGRIRLLFADNPNQWDFSGNGERYTARTRWQNDFTEWEVTGQGVRIIWRATHPLIRAEWVATRSSVGEVAIFTTFEGDYRDWSSSDQLHEDVSPQLKIFLFFITLFHSTLLVR